MSDCLHRKQLKFRIAGFIAMTLAISSMLFSFIAFEAYKHRAEKLGWTTTENRR